MVFQADDEGSIPFTRSIFKINYLPGILRPECVNTESARGNVRGNKRPDFELHPRERYEARARFKSWGTKRPSLFELMATNDFC